MIEYTRSGIEVNGETISPEDMVEWFVEFRQVEDWFDGYFDHDDCVTQYDHELALENQRDVLEENLPKHDHNYHDDQRHTGAVKWCDDPVCQFTFAAEEVLTW